MYEDSLKARNVSEKRNKTISYLYKVPIQLSILWDSTIIQFSNIRMLPLIVHLTFGHHCPLGRHQINPLMISPCSWNPLSHDSLAFVPGIITSTAPLYSAGGYLHSENKFYVKNGFKNITSELSKITATS